MYEKRGVYDSRLFSRKKSSALPGLLSDSFKGLGDNLDPNSMEGHPIHLFYPLGKICNRRILLVGDAAGVDPLLGEGIGIALGYGEATAKEIQHAIERNEFSFRGYHKAVVISPVGRTLLLRYGLAKFLYRFSHSAWFTKFFWKAASISDGIFLNFK